MSFEIGFKLTDLNELLSPSDISWNYDVLFRGIVSLSEGHFWLELNGEIIPSIYPGKRFINLEDQTQYGIRTLLVEFMMRLGKISQFIHDPVPQEIIDVVRSGALGKWRLPTVEITEYGEIKRELWQYKQALDLSLIWWEERRFEEDITHQNPIDIMLWPLSDTEICLYWCANRKEDKRDGYVLFEPGNREIFLEKSAFLLALQDFRIQLAAALLLRVDELKNRSLIDVIVTDNRGAEWFGAENILNELEEHLLAFDEAVSGSHDRSTDWPATLAAIRTLKPLIGPLF